MRNTLPLSSFPLQLLLTFETYFQPLFSLAFFLMLIYKTFNLPYDSWMMAQEGVIQGLYLVIMVLRIEGGKRANKTENSLYMATFMGACLLAIVISVYFIFIQYYVLLAELILVIIVLVVNAFELILGFFSCWLFQSYEKQQ